MVVIYVLNTKKKKTIQCDLMMLIIAIEAEYLKNYCL